MEEGEMGVGRLEGGREGSGRGGRDMSGTFYHFNENSDTFHH